MNDDRKFCALCYAKDGALVILNNIREMSAAGHCAIHGLQYDYVAAKDTLIHKETTMNRYYISAKHISSAIANNQNASGTTQTLEECIETAKRQVQNGEMEAVAIVKIVAIVRREKAPVTVERLEN